MGYYLGYYMGYYVGYYMGYYVGYYMGYGGPVGVSGWGGPAGARRSAVVGGSGASLCAWMTLPPYRRRRGLSTIMGYFLGKIDLGHCVNMNGAPRIRTPSRRSGARSCQAPRGDGCVRSAGGRAAVCGAPAGRVPVLGRFHHRRTPCLLCWVWGPGIAVLRSCHEDR